jgi:hypothetical protein
MRFLKPTLFSILEENTISSAHIPPPCATALLRKAVLELIRFDYLLARGDFPRLYDSVRRCAVERPWPMDLLAPVTRAVDYAAIFYIKPVLCLQHSAATACVLRHFGVRAELVLGAQFRPFKAHAWVEVDGRVVNDKPYTPELYEVLDRC